MNASEESSQAIPIACNLTAIPPELREQHMTVGLRVLQEAQEVQELGNGHAFRFANQPGILMAIANLVENERLCCPFYRFEIEVTPNGGPLWLRMTGGEGVKEFEQAIFHDTIEAVNQKRIDSGADSALNERVVETVTGLSALFGRATLPGK